MREFFTTETDRGTVLNLDGTILHVRPDVSVGVIETAVLTGAITSTVKGLLKHKSDWSDKHFEHQRTVEGAKIHEPFKQAVKAVAQAKIDAEVEIAKLNEMPVADATIAMHRVEDRNYVRQLGPSKLMQTYQSMSIEQLDAVVERIGELGLSTDNAARVKQRHAVLNYIRRNGHAYAIPKKPTLENIAVTGRDEAGMMAWAEARIKDVYAKRDTANAAEKMLQASVHMIAKIINTNPQTALAMMVE